MLLVILINPPFYRLLQTNREDTFPIGLGYISAYLRDKGFEVKMLDYDYRKDNIHETWTILKEKPGSEFTRDFDLDPIWDRIRVNLSTYTLDVVGITTVSNSFNSAIRVAKIVKEINTDCIVIIGGVHASALPEEVLQKDCFDIVVCGEGEITMVELLGAIQKGCKDFSNIRGLYFRRGERIVFTGRRPMIENLDTLPYPDREFYDINGKKFTNRSMSVIGSRGCLYDCNFCTNKEMWGLGLRLRSVDSIISEIQYLVGKFGEYYFRIYDEFFTSSRSRTLEFCKYIQKRRLDIRWWCQTRGDSLDEELIHEMSESGCAEICFGVESGDPRILEKYNKELDIEKMIQNSKNIRATKIKLCAFIILGYPDEDLSSLDDTEKLLYKLQPNHVIINYFVPLPGSRIYREMLAREMITDKNWWHYNFSNPNLVFKHPSFGRDLLARYHLRLKFIFDEGFKDEVFLSPKILLKAIKLMLFKPRIFMQILKIFLFT